MTKPRLTPDEIDQQLSGGAALDDDHAAHSRRTTAPARPAWWRRALWAVVRPVAAAVDGMLGRVK